MALRVALHQVGASALSGLLQYPEPDLASCLALASTRPCRSVCVPRPWLRHWARWNCSVPLSVRAPW